MFVNGDKFVGRNVTIINGKVTIDGVVQGNYTDQVINVTIEGDVGSIRNDSGDVTAHDVGSIKVGSGDVNCKNVGGNVMTGSGDVECGDVKGKVQTGSGDIRRK